MLRFNSILILLLFPFLVKATSYTSTANGNWSSSSTWSPTGVPGSGDNVIIANTVTLDANESVNNITINSGKTFTINAGETLTIYGNLTNNGTYTNTGVKSGLSFNGSANQTISGTGLINIENLTINTTASTDSVILNRAITVSDSLAITSGTLACTTFTLTGNATGTFTMASGTALVLGIPSSATLPGFPLNFTNGHINLNSNSTVTYQANNTSTGQTVSGVPYYGNLYVNTSSAGTSGGTEFYVKGNLNVSSAITFKMNHALDSIRGNLVIGSGTTYKTYSANEYLFKNLTNNGVYTMPNGGMARFAGNTNQVISAPSGPISTFIGTLWCLQGSGADSLLIEGGISMVYNIDNASTICVPAAYNDTVELAGQINNSGIITALNGVTYFRGGALATHPATFYKLTVSGTFSLYANATVKSDFTFLSGSLNFGGDTLILAGDYIDNATTAAIPGWMEMNGNHNQTIRGTASPYLGGLFINQASATDTVKLSDSTSFYNLKITKGMLDVTPSNYAIMISNYFWNSSTFVARHGTVTFVPYNLTTNETLGGSTSSTFYNLTINSTGTGTITMTAAETVTNSLTISAGTFYTSNYALTINSSSTLTMGANSLFGIGSNTNTTVVPFPSFTRSNISLAASSTIQYLSKTGSQVISTVPLYANLIIAGSVTATKNLSGTHLIVNSNLTVAASITLGVGADTVDLAGILTITGGLSYTTGILNIGGNFINNGTYTTGTSTTKFDGSANQALSGTGLLTFNNLTINEAASTDTVFMTKAMTVTKNLAISQGVLDCQNYQLTGSTTSGTMTMSIGTGLVLGLPSTATAVSFPTGYTTGNITLNSASSVTYQANLAQTISAAPAYGNLILSTGATATTKTLAGAITVNGNLKINTNTTLDCQTYQITGNATNNMTMASGSKLLLGVSGTGTNVLFPTNFGSGAGTISLNSNSTVVYQSANGSQSISSYPTYGILVISSTSSVTKTPTGTSLTIAGNLTVKGSATLSMTSYTINLMGIDSISSGATESFSSGALNIGGNLVCNGTFTYGTSTTTFNGASGQSISGSSYPTFYNLTISGTGGETVGLGGNQTVSNTLSITSGILDATILNYNVTIGGSFTNSGGTFNPRSNTVTMNGSTQTLGGTALINLNKLVISSGTTTLGGNVTTTSDITINSSATLNGASYTLTTAGNFIDNGTFTASTGTVYFNKNGHQCISGSSVPTFKNVTVSSLTTLAAPGTLHINGTVTVLPGGLMACAC